MDYLTYKIIMYTFLALAVAVLLVLSLGTWVHRDAIANVFSRVTARRRVTWDVPVVKKRWRPTTTTKVSIKYDKLYP